MPLARHFVGGGPQEYSGSGKIDDEVNLDQFIEVVDKIHKEGIRVNLLLNPTCEGSNWYCPEVIDLKIDFLSKMHKEHGIEAVTIANPIYIKEVRRHFPELDICASVLGEIDCMERAVIYNKAGANVITPATNRIGDLFPAVVELEKLI